MRYKEYTTTDKTFIDLMNVAYPQGRKYANRVINLAVELSKIATPFYCGTMINDYGIYPFLNAEALCYQDGKTYRDHVIIRSEFDNEEFLDWVDGLSLSNEEKRILKNDVSMCSRDKSGLLDQSYLSAIQYLIEFFKCIEKRRKERIFRMNNIISLPVGCSTVVVFDSIFTKNHMMRKIQKFNKKKREKYLIAHEYPGLSLDKCVVVCCLKHMPK